MKKYTLLVFTIIALGAGAYFTERSFLASSAPAVSDAKSVEAPAQAPNITLKVSGTSYGIYVPAGATVLDAMNTLSSAGEFHFTAKEFSGMGVFVESINGKQNADGLSWFLYVNGKSSDTGASQTALKAGDTVEWRYEKNNNY